MRKSIPDHIAKILGKKTSRYVVVANLSFLMSLLLLCIVSIVVWNQYQTIKTNFVDNGKTHVIEISGSVENNSFTPISYSTKTNIINYLNNKGYEGQYRSFLIYQLTSLTCEGKEDWGTVLFSVEPDGEPYLFGDKNLKNNTLYSDSIAMDPCVFLVPKVEVQGNQMYLSDDRRFILNTVKVPDNYFNIKTYDDDFDLHKGFISYATFCEFIAWQYGVNLQDTHPLDAKSLESLSVYEECVYVENMKDVERIAKELNKGGYTTNFVFQSFEEIGNSLGTALTILFVASIFALLATLAIMVLSWKNYVHLLSKDIGILKQMGYPVKMINEIFGKIIIRHYIRILLISLSVFVVAACFVLGKDGVQFTVSFSLFLVCLLLIVYLFVYQVFLKNATSKDVLELMRHKSFE